MPFPYQTETPISRAIDGGVIDGPFNYPLTFVLRMNRFEQNMGTLSLKEGFHYQDRGP